MLTVCFKLFVSLLNLISGAILNSEVKIFCHYNLRSFRLHGKDCSKCYESALSEKKRSSDNQPFNYSQGGVKMATVVERSGRSEKDGKGDVGEEDGKPRFSQTTFPIREEGSQKSVSGVEEIVNLGDFSVKGPNSHVKLASGRKDAGKMFVMSKSRKQLWDRMKKRKATAPPPLVPAHVEKMKDCRPKGKTYRRGVNKILA